MATLVLTTVGTLVGGPIGGAVGALIGQQIDQRLFAPRRQGPRLGDLGVQLSRYGQPIPRLFGTMRVSGSVIWATDLIEDKHKAGGGKGKPKTTTYSYSASFAVALSARPIRAVHRIWADGKLLRGAAGDWKSEIGAFRLYMGDESQPVDPLIASAEGLGNTPAFRGVAYAVFEHLQLADFANHIPSLSFEVEADDGDVTVHAILAELSDGAIAGADSVALGGFAASGDSARGVIEAIGRSIDLSLYDDGTVLRLADMEADPVALAEDQLGGSPDGRRRARHSAERTASGTLPDEVAIAYYEPARDYQTGLQRARRGGPGHRVEQIELSAAVTAEMAKAIAEQRLAERWTGRVQRNVTMPWRTMDVRPGDHVTVPGQPGRWRVREAAIEKMAVELKLTSVAPRPGDPPPAAPGRVTGSPDTPHGETVLHVIDIPAIEDGALATPRLWIVAAGTAAGWRRAGLIASSDGGLTYDELGATAAPAVMGVAIDALAPGAAGLFDEMNSVEIELLHDGMNLEGRADAALLGGANLALLGNELIQFGRVEMVGANGFRLERLMRGRRGTEWAMTGHEAGERFILIAADSLLAWDVPAAKIGGTLSVIGSGIGDGSGVEAELVLVGRSVRPPAPVHLNMTRLDDGTLRFGWTRRSRTGWGWLDGATHPWARKANATGLRSRHLRDRHGRRTSSRPPLTICRRRSWPTVSAVRPRFRSASGRSDRSRCRHPPRPGPSFSRSNIMAENSDRFALPLLSAGQAQKELHHNEALTILDLLGHAAVEGNGVNTPPATPDPGQCWIVGSSPTGAWAGRAGALAGWTSGGWRFVAPRAGMIAWDAANGHWLHYDGSMWVNGVLTATRLEIGGIQVVGDQSGAIADPIGGSFIDDESRSRIVLILNALRTHGLIAP
jgi:hypothetical protein